MKNLKDQKGMAIVLFLAILLMLTLVGVVAIMNSSNNLDVSGNKMNSNETLYAADLGLELAIAGIRAFHDVNADSMTDAQLPCSTFTKGGLTISYQTKKDNATTQHFRDIGTFYYQPYQRVRARKIFYVVVSQAASTDGRYRSRVSARVVANMLRLFSFDAFYDGNLEFSSESAYAADTHFQAIHSNSNIYLEQPASATNFLRFRQGVSAGRKIYHGHDTTYASSPTKSGKVLILSARTANSYDTLNIDATNTGWVDTSMARWKGMVQDSLHNINQTKLRVVRPYNTNPIDWIARAVDKPTMSLERTGVCGLKIYTRLVSGVYRDSAYWWNAGTSSWVNRTDSIFNRSPRVVTRRHSYDFRENDTLILYCINLDSLRVANLWPSTGILYMYRDTTASTRRQPAIMIWGGNTLANDLTIVSKNPVYIQGNFNIGDSVHKAAIIADAVTEINSPYTNANGCTSWVAATTHPQSAIAANRIIRAAIVTGNVPTNAARFSGGVNNLVRLLEDWTMAGRLTMIGPQICLWNSQQDTARYQSPGMTANIYFPPANTGAFRYIHSDTTIGDTCGFGLPARRRFPPFPDDGPYAVYIEVLNRTVEEVQ